MFNCERFPHVQVEGMLDGSQPYLRAIASQNAPLCKMKPFSSICRVVNKLDAPFFELDPLSIEWS